MCRLFGMTAGHRPLRATFWLLDAPDSLRTQSRRDADGTGIGYFDGNGAPHVEKAPIAAFDDRDFAAQARRVWSRTFVAHVRHATNGGLTMANTHPFCMDGRLFAHNGVVGDIPRLEHHLGDDIRRVTGESDSERCFALITREIAAHAGDVEAGIRAAVGWVVDELPVVSINFVLATSTDLWALRYPETDSLYVLDRRAGGSGTAPDEESDGGSPLAQTSSDGTRVESADAGLHPVVLLASERMDEDPHWRALRSGELLHVPPSLEVSSALLFGGAAAPSSS
jgi:predicted glutamine amidotransferase